MTCRQAADAASVKSALSQHASCQRWWQVATHAHAPIRPAPPLSCKDAGQRATSTTRPPTWCQWKPKRQGPARPGPQDTGAEPARLRTEDTQLVTAEKEWSLAREILRRAAACFAKEMKRRPARWDYQGTERSPRHPPQAVMTTDARSPPAETGGASSCHQISHDSHRPHRRLRITRLRAGLRDPAGRGAVASAAIPPPGPAESPRDRAMFGRGDGPARAVWRRGAE